MNTDRRSLDGRWIALLVVGCYALAGWLALRSWGLERTLNLAGVPPIGAPFADLYIFPAAAHTVSLGGNPYLDNPFDPWGRVYNYPRLWLTFMRYSPAAVPTLGIALGVLWLASLGVVWGRLSLAEGLVGGLLAVSPAAVLGVERANSDLIVFLLLVLAIVAVRRQLSQPAAWLLVVFSGTLKLFPAAGALVFLRCGWARARWWLLAAFVVLGLWAARHWTEIAAALGNTPAGGAGISYGATVLVSIADQARTARVGDSPRLDSLRWIATAAAGVLVAAAAAMGLRAGSRKGYSDRGIDAFRVGAAIYVATFIAGSNFDYRRIFLFLCLPFLWPWGEAQRWRALRGAALGCILAGAWSNTYWTDSLAIVRELTSWALALLLAWLLAATALGSPSAASNVRPSTA